MESSGDYAKAQQSDGEAIPSGGRSVGQDLLETPIVPVFPGFAEDGERSRSAVAVERSMEEAACRDEELLSSFLRRASPGGAFATLRSGVKEDAADFQEEVVKAPGSARGVDDEVLCSAPLSKVPPKLDGEEAVTHTNCFESLTSRVACTEASTEARRCASTGSILSVSGGLLVDGAANGKGEGGTIFDAVSVPSGRYSVGIEDTSVATTDKECGECPAREGEAATGDHFSSVANITALGEDVLDATGLSGVAAGKSLSKRLVREDVTVEERGLSRSSPSGNGVTGKAPNLAGERGTQRALEAHDMHTQVATPYQKEHPSEKAVSEEGLALSFSCACDDGEEANTQGRLSRSCVSVGAPERSQSVLQNPFPRGPLFFAEGNDREPSTDGAEASTGENDSTKTPSVKLQQPRPDQKASHVVSTPRRLVEEHYPSHEEIGDASKNGPDRLLELRQFTLELLYAVSLVRPLGKKSRCDGDMYGNFIRQTTLKGDRRERVRASSAVQLASRSEAADQERETGPLPESFRAEGGSPGTEWAEGETALDSQQRRAVSNGRQSQNRSVVDCVATLEQRVSSAFLLCAEEASTDGLSTAEAFWRTGNRGRCEGNVSEHDQDLGRDREDAADVALAAVAAAGTQPQHRFFEAFAEKITASKTIKELVLLLCNYFGPLLHLLQEHLTQNRLKRSDGSIMDTPSRSAGRSNRCLNIAKAVSHLVAYDTEGGLQRQQHSNASKVDETVQKVNAILQVLTETEQSAANVALDSVCERLFSSQSRAGPLLSSSSHFLPVLGAKSEGSAFTTGKRVATQNIHSRLVSSGENGSCALVCESNTGPQFSSRDDVEEALSGEDDAADLVRTPSRNVRSMSAFPDVKSLEGSLAENDAGGDVTDVRDCTQVLDDTIGAIKKCDHKEQSMSYITSDESTGEEKENTAEGVSSVSCALPAEGVKHEAKKTSLAFGGLAGVSYVSDGEQEPLWARGSQTGRHQEGQETHPGGRTEAEDRHGGGLGDESQASRTAWLAAQLSTPLDVLGGDSARERDAEPSNEKVSEDVAQILETLVATGFDQSRPSAEGSSTVRSVTENQTAENTSAPHAWETGVQLVLRMLREQEQQFPLYEDVSASSEERCMLTCGRNPKRRAVYHGRDADEVSSSETVPEGKQVDCSLSDVKPDGNTASVGVRGSSPAVVSPVSDALLTTRQGVKTAAQATPSCAKEKEEESVADASRAAARERNAAAAAVERAAAAVAQQGAVAAVEQANLGRAEMLRKVREIGNSSTTIEGSTSTFPVTTGGLAASSCHALRRAVEYVTPSATDGKEELSVGSREMFAELDNEGLDSLVSQLLKLAGRAEQRRGQDISREQLLRLITDLQGQGGQFSARQSPSSPEYTQPVRGHQQSQQPQLTQHIERERKLVEGSSRLRHGGTRGGSPVSALSPFQKETDVFVTRHALQEKINVSSSGAGLVTTAPSYLRVAETVQRVENLLSARRSTAADRHTGITNSSGWSACPPSAGSSRLSLDVLTTGNTIFSARDHPPLLRSYLTETPPATVAHSVNPPQPPHSLKRSPWRSSEPYSSSASTAASPVGSSSRSFGSSSLASSPFSLLPASATAAFQAAGAALKSQIRDTGEASTVVGPGGARHCSASGDHLKPGRDSSLSPIQGSLDGGTQHRFPVEGARHPFGLLPAGVSGEDSYFKGGLATSSGAPGVRGQTGETAAGVRGEHRGEVVAAVHRRALDFFDVEVSARAHLLRDNASPSAAVKKALSAIALAVPVAQGHGSGSGQRSERLSLGAGLEQANADTKEIPEGSSERLACGNGLMSTLHHKKVPGLSVKSPRSFEDAGLRSARVSPSIRGRSMSEALCSSAQADGLQSPDFGKLPWRQASRTRVDTHHTASSEQLKVRKVINHLHKIAEGASCPARLRSGEIATEAARVLDGHEQHHYDAASSSAVGQRWVHAVADSSARSAQQQQQHRYANVKSLDPRVGTLTHTGLLRSRYTGGACQEDRDGAPYCGGSRVSAAFSRSTVPGVRRETAAVGCVGSGGADCSCGGALCLYRSAVSGVVYDKSGQKWTARWNEDGRQHKRTFAAAKYGFLTAKLKAETCRGEARERTARAKHEALQQQQESLAHRIGLLTAAPSAADGGQSHRCAVSGSTTSAANRGVTEQKKVRP